MRSSNVKVRQVDDLSSPEFQQAAEIYLTSFPSNETRPVEKTRALLESGRYRLYVAQTDDGVMAFALVYMWEEFALLDYMAVSDRFQNMGIGSALFRDLAGFPDCGMILLEVQKPDGADPKKADRLRFYERLGARVIADGYMLPPYDGSEPEEMYLMAVAPVHQPFRRDDVRTFVRRIYRDVYAYEGTDLVEKTMRSVPDVVGRRK